DDEELPAVVTEYNRALRRQVRLPGSTTTGREAPERREAPVGPALERHHLVLRGVVGLHEHGCGGFAVLLGHEAPPVLVAEARSLTGRVRYTVPSITLVRQSRRASDAGGHTHAATRPIRRARASARNRRESSDSAGCRRATHRAPERPPRPDETARDGFEAAGVDVPSRDPEKDPRASDERWVHLRGLASQAFAGLPSRTRT